MYRPWHGYLVLFALFACYLTIQCRAFLFAPRLNVISPLLVSMRAGSEFTIKGNADKMSHVTLNGQAIAFDINGNFLQNVLVQKGVTRIEVASTSRFGKVSKKTITLVGKE